MNGPYETFLQVDETPAVRAAYAAFDAAPSVGAIEPHNRRMIEEACHAAGVELGAYDRRIVAWLAGWEPQTCAVIAGLIRAPTPTPATGSGPARATTALNVAEGRSG